MLIRVDHPTDCQHFAYARPLAEVTETAQFQHGQQEHVFASVRLEGVGRRWSTCDL